MSLILSPEAEADLLDIWAYIADDSPINADRFIDRLYEKAEKLCDFPKRGVDRSHLLPDLRCLVVARYCIYYRESESGIEIVRVLHSARDPLLHLSPDP